MRVRIPSGPLMTFDLGTPLAAVFFFFLLAAPVHAVFLVGEGNSGEAVSVLCEQQEKIFVSSPDGSVRQLDLDSSYQAEFVPREPGPHTVQCGRETKTVEVASAQQGSDAMMEEERKDALAVLAASALFLAVLLSAALLLAKDHFSRTVFSKAVGGGRARLFLQPAKRLERIEIEDPVSFSYGRQPLRFSIPSLDAGREWSWEYDIKHPEKALPATLEALQNGKGIAMLSKLSIEGEEKKSPDSGAPPAIKRKLPKAR